MNITANKINNNILIYNQFRFLELNKDKPRIK